MKQARAKGCDEAEVGFYAFVGQHERWNGWRGRPIEFRNLLLHGMVGFNLGVTLLLVGSGYPNVVHSLASVSVYRCPSQVTVTCARLGAPDADHHEETPSA